MKIRIGILTLILTLSLSSNPVFGATVKIGATCPKAGLVSGSLICQKSSGTLKWRLLKKAQRITYSSPVQGSVADKYLKISYASTSKLVVSAKSLTPLICSVANSTLEKIVTLKGAAGLCSISLNQRGNLTYLAAKSVSIKISILGLNVITFTMPSTLLLRQGSYILTAASSAGLPVSLESTTLSICTIQNSTLALVAAGNCSLTASQPGAAYIPTAVSVTRTLSVTLSPNSIAFQLPAALLLSQGTLNLNASTTSNLPITFTSSTKDVCTVSSAVLKLLKAGSCTVTASQSASQLFFAPMPVTRTVEISLLRVTADLPDSVAGFQIKAIYVVPSDGVDNSYDTNGRIAAVLKEGTDYLRQELGLTLPIDSTSVGYDITYLKSSKLTSYFLTANNLNDELMVEGKFLETPGLNRKDYVFFIDIADMKSGGACGYASKPGISAVVAIGQLKCGSKTQTFDNNASLSWVHEVFHNFGVEHVPDPCDLMFGTLDFPAIHRCDSSIQVVIDRNRNRYVGSAAYGQNILQLRVWDGHTADKGLKADCWVGFMDVPRRNGMNYAYCPTGTRAVGALKFCWSSIQSVALEELIDGGWKSLGVGSYHSKFWGGELAGRSCNDPNYVTPWKQITVNDPGIRHYRWIVDGKVAEEIEIIWVN